MLRRLTSGSCIFLSSLAIFLFFFSWRHNHFVTLFQQSGKCKKWRSHINVKSLTNGPHQRSPVAALGLFNQNVSKGSEAAGASPFLEPSKANKSNSERRLPPFWLELDELRLISSGVIWCFISLGSPTDGRQRDRVVSLAVLTAEGSAMTEPEANNSHYPSALVPFTKKKKFCATHFQHFHKQEAEIGKNDSLSIFVVWTNTAQEKRERVNSWGPMCFAKGINCRPDGVMWETQ